MFEWINLAVLVASILLFSILYAFSVMPAIRGEKKGNEIWIKCRNLRIVSSIFEGITLVSLILWIWFPIEQLNWKIFSKWWIGIIVSMVIFIPGGIIVLKGVKDAGKETLTPSKDTEMFGGIYKYIRHPQTTGEMPMFPAFGLVVNSWFMVLIMTIFIIIYVPIIQYLEEKDLVKRFGDSYIEYQKTTGAFLPKWKILKSLFKWKKRE